MQAAIVSVLLMAGVCGAPPHACSCADSPAVVQQSDDNTAGGCPDCDRNRALWSPVTANGTITYDRDLLGRPLYSPLWYVRSRATFYPGNYAKPYDYREAFGYPWNGPRPLVAPAYAPTPTAPPFAGAPLPPEPPSSAASPWPASTVAEYLRQSQARVASKPTPERP